ncbi:MAG: 6-carboxytetrahydropterin synthase, partial [Candidatus Omnitrophota bacterium]
IRLAGGLRERPHRHDWKAAVTVEAASLDTAGLVVDFVLLGKTLNGILGQFEKQRLENHPHFQGGRRNASAENVARYIYEKVKKEMKSKRYRVANVTVWEAPGCSADYYETD